MQKIVLDMYMTAGVGVAALLLGMFFTRTVPFLKRMCIPAPVSGGLVVSLLTLLVHSLGGVDFDFDGTVKDICMMLFFTSVGFQSDLRMLKRGGRPLVMMVLLVAGLIVVQNLLSVGIARGMGLDPLVGMAAGSIPMCGGHGTAGGFSPVLERLGLQGAASVTMAAATFGLVAGSMIGGPVAEMLVRRRRLAAASDSEDVVLGIEASEAAPERRAEHTGTDERSFREYSRAVYQLVIAMALGMGLSKLLALTGITFPTYFGSLIVAAVIRNLFGREHYHPRTPGSAGSPPACSLSAGSSPADSLSAGSSSVFRLSLDKIVSVGNICLSLFLGMAMSSLKLWELAGLVLPLVVILLAQAAFIALYATFVAFPALGRTYDAAVLVSGLCGFGLGATPNAMANMSAVCFKYHYAVNPFIIVPIVGAMFVDLINTGVITVFLNLL